MDLEYGFSCMGYEVAGPWGAAMARSTTHPDGVVTALLGDGSYLMLNSELYSAALSGHPFVAVVCDNGGYAVIHRLQTGQGADGFNNLLDDCAGPGAEAGLRVDFAAHAASLGAHVEVVAPDGSVDDLAAAYAAGQGGGGGRAPTRRRRVPHPPVVVDRGRCVVGGRRARRPVRPRVVRPGEGPPAPLAHLTTRRTTSVRRTR